jgi:hypothetical protein|tara:strand:- start:56 stop:370 length:315 start_codon:yes stop_codon:yes gene_type:complete
MKSVIIEAKTGSEENGNLKEFTSEVEMPEDIEEAISQYGSDEVFKIWYGAIIVRLQGNLRKPEGAKNTKTLDVYRKLRPLIDSGAMDDSQARDVSGYRGEWPVA